MSQLRAPEGQCCGVVNPDLFSLVLFPCSVDWCGHRDLSPGAVQEPGLLSAVSMHTCALPACMLCSSSPHVCLLLRVTRSNPLPMLMPPQPRDGATEVSKSWFGKTP